VWQSFEQIGSKTSELVGKKKHRIKYNAHSLLIIILLWTGHVLGGNSLLETVLCGLFSAVAEVCTLRVLSISVVVF